MTEQANEAAGGTDTGKTATGSSSSAGGIQDVLAGAQGGAGNDAGKADADKSAAGDAGSGSGADASADRPDFLDEDYWDKDKKAPRLDVLAADAKAGREARLKAEERARSVPEKPDGYKLELPKDFAPPEGVTLPEGFALDANDPLIKAGMEFAHQRGMSQDEFNALVGLKVRQDLAENAAMQAAMSRQFQALGEKAKDRVGAVASFVRGQLPEGQAEAILKMIVTKDQVEAFEALAVKIANGGSAGFGAGDGKSGNPAISEEAYAKLSADEKFELSRKLKKTA